MEISPGIVARNWILLVGPRSMNASVLVAVARLGERGALRVLDCGNRFNAYTVARAARGRPDVLNRITVARAFTCYQVLSALEGTPALLAPVVILDLLSTFYDESVPAGERKRLLRACIAHLERLEGAAGSPAARAPQVTCVSMQAARSGMLPALYRGGASPESPRLMVSVHPPAVSSLPAVEFLELLQASTVSTFFIQPDAPAPEPPRLF